MLQTIVQRFVRMARFDWTVYSEISQDDQATQQAALIVGIVALLSALGTAIGSGSFVAAFLVKIILVIAVNWLLWTYALVFAGTNFMGSTTSFWPMARALGYAMTPMILVALSRTGCLGWPVQAVAWLATLVLCVFAVREALVISTEKSIAVTAATWLVIVIIATFPSLIFSWY